MARVGLGLAVMAPVVLATGAAFAKDPADLYADASPAVVFIAASDGKVMGTGTGSIIKSNGVILTNFHVIGDLGSKQVMPKLAVGFKPAQGTKIEDWRPAKVVVANPTYDLAVLKVDGVGLPVMPVGNPADIRVGDPLFVIGHPGTGGLWSFTSGMLSARHSSYSKIPGYNILQTNADINKGNSGGPLLDKYGRLVGVNTFVFRNDKRSGFTWTGINFACDAETAVRWLKQSGINVQLANPPRPAIAQAPPPPAAPTAKPAAPAAPPPPVRQEETPRQAEAVTKPPRTIKPRQLTPRRPYNPEEMAQTGIERVRKRAQKAFNELEEMERRMGK